MLHPRSRLIGYAAVLSLALSALSPAHAQQAAKPVQSMEGRDLDCLTALVTFGMFTDQQIEKKGANTPEGQSYVRMAKINTGALGWYLGRLSTLPPERVNRAASKEASARFQAQEAEEAMAQIQACTAFYQDNAQKTINTLFE